MGVPITECHAKTLPKGCYRDASVYFCLTITQLGTPCRMLNSFVVEPGSVMCLCHSNWLGTPSSNPHSPPPGPNNIYLLSVITIVLLFGTKLNRLCFPVRYAPVVTQVVSTDFMGNAAFWSGQARPGQVAPNEYSKKTVHILSTLLCVVAIVGVQGAKFFRCHCALA